MAAKKNITHLIERLELFEERLGVRLERLSAIRGYRVDNDLMVSGELHAKPGRTLKETIELVVVVYDYSGRVIGLTRRTFVKGRFLGFEQFSERLSGFVAPLAKVRVYPKRRR